MPAVSGGCGGPDCRYGDLTCASATNCSATGSYCDDDDCDSTSDFAQVWNGTTWNAVPLAKDAHLAQLTLLSCGSPVNCVALGTRPQSGGTTPAPVAEHWNGKSWLVTKFPT
jgi:hypothetical protein